VQGENKIYQWKNYFTELKEANNVKIKRREEGCKEKTGKDGEGKEGSEENEKIRLIISFFHS